MPTAVIFLSLSPLSRGLVSKLQRPHACAAMFCFTIQRTEAFEELTCSHDKPHSTHVYAYRPSDAVSQSVSAASVRDAARSHTAVMSNCRAVQWRKTAEDVDRKHGDKENELSRSNDSRTCQVEQLSCSSMFHHHILKAHLFD